MNPQIDVPKEKIMRTVRANVREGNGQISLATADMFIWGQVHTDVPFYFPNREALLDLYSEIVNTPGVERHLLSHATIAPPVVDPLLIEKLSDTLLDKSPIHLPTHGTHPRKKILSPLMGLETGSVRMARTIMPSKAVPFSIDDWPSIVINGLTILNRNNWFPVFTLMIGNPGETDEDVTATLDLTPLQWQLMMKCWKLNLRPGQYSWWGPTAWRLGALALWLAKLRSLNGPNFTWPLLMFANAVPEGLTERMGKIYVGKPLQIKSRKELLATIKPRHWKYLRADNGELPDGYERELAQQAPGPLFRVMGQG